MEITQLKDTKYIKDVKSVIHFDFGVYYFFDKFIVGEANEGVHITKEKVGSLVKKASELDIYTQEEQLAFIANRVRSYSVDPLSWHFLKKQNHPINIVATSVVCYKEATYLAASLEKKISPYVLKRSNNLKEAIEWVKNLNEFKK